MNRKNNSSGVRQKGFGTSEMVEDDSYQNVACISLVKLWKKFNKDYENLPSHYVDLTYID